MLTSNSIHMGSIWPSMASGAPGKRQNSENTWVMVCDIYDYICFCCAFVASFYCWPKSYSASAFPAQGVVHYIESHHHYREIGLQTKRAYSAAAFLGFCTTQSTISPCRLFLAFGKPICAAQSFHWCPPIILLPIYLYATIYWYIGGHTMIIWE